MRNGIEHCHYCLEGHMKLCQQFFYRLKFKIFNLLPVNITFSVANIFRIRKYRTPKLKYISLLFNYKKIKICGSVVAEDETYEEFPDRTSRRGKMSNLPATSSVF